MPVLSPSSDVFRFGLFEVDCAREILARNGVRVRIQNQPFRVLVLLLERHGEIVTREELKDALWPDGTHVDFDGSLNVILKRLRAAIDDDPENPRFIETIPRRGYRFIAPVTRIERGPEKDLRPTPEISPVPAATIKPDSTAQTTETAVEGRSNRPQGRRYLISAPALAFLVIALGAWMARHYAHLREGKLSQSAPVPVRKSLAVLGFRNLTGRPDDAWLAT